MLPASINRYLEQHGVHFCVVEHPIAYTAQEDAAATHVRGREWAKAVVCMIDDRPMLAVLPADRLVDLDRLREACGAHSARLAREPEFRPFYADCEVGAMPPLGTLYGLPVYLDNSLAGQETIAFNAGTHREVMHMGMAEFRRIVSPEVVSAARELAFTRSW